MGTVLTQSQLDGLTVEQKLALLEQVWGSLADDSLPVPDWHNKVLDERLKRIEEQPHKGIPWKDAREILRKRREADADRDS